MILTDRAMKWLDQNRFRSFPMESSEWRKKVSPASGLDRVLLDALLFDAGASGNEELVVESISVSDDDTVVSMSYGGTSFNVVLTFPSPGGGLDYETVRGRLTLADGRSVSISLVFSKHLDILGAVGTGSWNLGCRVLGSRVVRLSDGIGVDEIVSNGSSGVEGHSSARGASGDVVLVDGYRTSPIIQNGRVLVRVGKRFGKDPCHYDFGDEGATDCRKPLFFFCGQNAINSGNVVLKGGYGISVSQGRKYAVRSGRLSGREVPCIEVVANSDLLGMYSPL